MKAIIPNVTLDPLFPSAHCWHRPPFSTLIPSQMKNLRTHFGRTILSMYTVMRYSFPHPAHAKFPGWSNACS